MTQSNQSLGYLFFIMPLTINIVCVCFLLSSPSFGQISGFEISGGGRVTTLDASQIRLNQLSTLIEDNRFGGNAFSKLHINLGTRWIKIAPEAFFIQNGAQEMHQNLSTVGQNIIDRKIRLNYVGVNLPLSIFIPFKKDAIDFGMELYGSGFADYALSGSFEDNNGIGQDLDFGTKTSNKIDLGISTGAGILLGGFVVRAGFDQGLKEISFITAANNSGSSEYNIKNSGFYATIGFMGTINN